MKKIFRRQIFLFVFLCSAHICGAQDLPPKGNASLSQEMLELKSEFNVFLKKSQRENSVIFLDQMIIAIENSVISEGVTLNQLNEVFSEKIIIPEITKGLQVVKDVGLLPLNGSYWDKRKLPGVPGPSWFLIFRINEKKEVHRLSLRYMTVKDLYINWYE